MIETVPLCLSLMRLDTIRVRSVLNETFKIMISINSELFLRASAMLKHVIDIGWTSVRPAVCPSVTRWYGTVSKRLNISSA